MYPLEIFAPVCAWNAQAGLPRLKFRKSRGKEFRNSKLLYLRVILEYCNNKD